MKIELGRSFGDSRTGNRLSYRVRPSLQALEGKIFLTSMAGAVLAPPAQVSTYPQSENVLGGTTAQRTAGDPGDIRNHKRIDPTSTPTRPTASFYDTTVSAQRTIPTPTSNKLPKTPPPPPPSSTHAMPVSVVASTTVQVGSFGSSVTDRR